MGKADGGARVRRAFLARTFHRVGTFLAGLPRSLRLVLVLAWAGFIWGLSEREGSTKLPSSTFFSWVGNMAHAPLFGVLGLLALALAVDPRPGGWSRPTRAQAAWLLLLVGAYGALDEYHQSHTPGRTSSWTDVLTDVVGAAAVLWVADHVARSEPREPGLGRRLALGALACAAAAALATWG